ncbi:hypothetical protein [Rubellimicrobium aerolatum]|uniref:Uncharacterized protein n=1 Tax=Rubellimicrobium aerolatum TaxID=490979 RepID=A0ABW0S909_9RHOB|nr:hypothetical protein [Rubellimicrobium aerolatum]MBP1804786.1 hypothetical protein [Rubellimicrobium aerolatum]
MAQLIPFALAAALLAAPLHAQDTGEGQSLLDQGTGFLRGLLGEEAPALPELALPDLALPDLGGIAGEYLPTFSLLASEMGPAFVEVFGRIDSISNYESPVILPNGDIILRRSPDAPDWTPPEPGPESGPESGPAEPQTEL